MRLLEPGRRSSESVRSCWACSSSARAHGSHTNGALSTAMRACKPGTPPQHQPLLGTQQPASKSNGGSAVARSKRRRAATELQACAGAWPCCCHAAGQDGSTHKAAAHLLQGGQHGQHLHEALVGAAPLRIHVLLQPRADGHRIVEVAADAQVVLRSGSQAVWHSDQANVCGWPPRRQSCRWHPSGSVHRQPSGMAHWSGKGCLNMHVCLFNG